MTKKRPPKQRAWNKGLEVGKRDGFTPDQVKRIWGLLASQQRAPVLGACRTCCQPHKGECAPPRHSCT
jgi:hypothetical protein